MGLQQPEHPPVDHVTWYNNEALLRLVIATAPDGVVIVEADGIIRCFNPAAERMFGYRAHDVIGRDLAVLMPAAGRSDFTALIDPCEQPAGVRILGAGREAIARRKDGSEFPIELTVGTAVLDGSPVVAGFIRDISARRRSERRIAELQDELAHVARLEAMGELASALAHELNQPLTAVSNYAQAARTVSVHGGAEAAETAAELLNKAIDQAQRAGQIIRRLRGFIARGDTERTLEDPRAVIEDAAQLGLIGTSQRGIRFALDAPEEIEPLLIDRVQIQQVVQNLVRNAVEVLDDWDGDRQIRLELTETADRALSVQVSDSGPGVAPELKDRLFDPFVTTKANGMGIGLSMSRTIVEAHGGRLFERGNAWGGATIGFILPRVRAEGG